MRKTLAISAIAGTAIIGASGVASAAPLNLNGYDVPLSTAAPVVAADGITSTAYGDLTVGDQRGIINYNATAPLVSVDLRCSGIEGEGIGGHGVLGSKAPTCTTAPSVAYKEGGGLF